MGIKKGQHQKNGLALVEMVLVLPILLLLCFGVIEYGGLFWRYQQIQDVARQASRQAALYGSTQTQVNSTITTLMNNNGLGSSGYTVAYSTDPGTAATGTLITVTLSVPYTNVSLTHMSLFPKPTTLRQKVTMSKEGP